MQEPVLFYAKNAAIWSSMSGMNTCQDIRARPAYLRNHCVDKVCNSAGPTTNG